jgi:hypothetical protein
MGRMAEPLKDDCSHFRPLDGAYSPYGVFYGTPSNLTEHMAFKTLQRDAVTHFSLEDVFADGSADKLAWVVGWRKLPHIDREVQRQHEYPQQFAEEIFDRIEHALRRRVSGAEPNNVSRTGRVFRLHEDSPQPDAEAPLIAEVPVRYIGSSDMQIVAAHKAEFYDQSKLLHDRQEGHFVVSYETSGGWVAIKKDILTEVIGAGRDVQVVGLPPVAAEVLMLMCPNIAGTQNVAPNRQASVPPSMLKA